MTDNASTPPGWYPAEHANGEQRYWDGSRWLETTPDEAYAHAQQAASKAGSPPPPAGPSLPGAPPLSSAAPPATRLSTKRKAKVPGRVWAVIGVLAVVAVIIIIGTINERRSGPDTAAGESPTATSTPSARPTASSKPTPRATPTPTPSPTPAPAPAAPAVDVPHQDYAGSGDFVIDVAITSAAIVSFRCDLCDGNTVLKSNGNESLIVNEIGSYAGVHLINIYDNSATTQFVITADSDWTLTVDDITLIPRIPGPASGVGDYVFYMESSFDRAAITNNGDSNFVVYDYGSSGYPLIVNEIGAYSGTVPMDGPGIIEVDSNGTWSITPG